MAPHSGFIRPERLGSAAFRHDHGVRYAYVAGAMAKGIASVDLVARLGRAGLLGYYGSGGQRLDVVESAIRRLRSLLPDGQPFGVNLLHQMAVPELEEALVDLLLRYEVREIEAAAFVGMTPALVRYRVAGLRQRPDGSIRADNRIIGKASRPEVGRHFLEPPPRDIVDALLSQGRIGAEQAELARFVPTAGDLCAEADSGGHTDRRAAMTLLPRFLELRDDAVRRHGYAQAPGIGLAGGLGTPAALAAAFVMGADFVMTGSINQCTVEAGTSDGAKDLLAAADIQDTAMAPAGDLFEIGAQVQVLRKGVLFPARANRLYELYRQHEALDRIDERTIRMIETRYLGRGIEEVWEETRRHYAQAAPDELARAEANPKQKMAMIFRWYWIRANRLALGGDAGLAADYQIHCGPAMGAFNHWVNGTRYENWRNRHVDEIADLLMRGAAGILSDRLMEMTENDEPAAAGVGEGG